MAVTLPTTGSLSLAQIRAEFGAPAGTPLHAFVRGGSWVPNVSPNSGVPTSPPVSIDDLRGATAYTPVSVTVSDASISSTTHGTGNLTVGTTKLTASNGTGSYTFTATRISGNSAITASISTNGTATFRRNVVDPGGGAISAVYRLTASDGTTSAYKDVTVTTTSLA